MSKVTKTEKILRKATGKWEKFLAEGAFNQAQTQEPIDEARMGEYGKIDAQDGNPPTKIGRGNEEYMAAYNAVLQARGEEPLDIQKPDQAYLDALQQGRMKPSDHSYNLEEQEKKSFKVGEFVYVVNGSLKGASGKILEPITTSTGEEGFVIELYSDAKMKVFGKRGDEVIVLPGDLESGGTSDDMELYDIDERSEDDERDLEEPVKYGSGAELEWDTKAQKFYDRKRDMYIDDKEEEDNLTREGAGHDESIAQAQNQGVAFIRGRDDRAAGKERDPSFSEESGRNPLEVLFYNAGYGDEKTI